MKKILGFLAVACVFLAWMGCASSKSFDGFGCTSNCGGNTNVPSGNWAFITSNSIEMGGPMTISGSTVSGNLYVVGASSTGFLLGPSSVPMAISGTFSGGTLKFTGVINSSTITVTFTGLSTNSGQLTSLTGGTYTVSGGTDSGDAGTIGGALAGSFTGTWRATLASGGVMQIAMGEATTANSSSQFLMTPTGTGVTFSGVAGCAVTGTLNADSFAAGGLIILDISTIDQTVGGSFGYLGVANSASTPTQIAGTYVYSGGSACMLDNTQTQDVLDFTKQ